MKKIYMLCLMLFVALASTAQDFEIISVESQPNDFSAREEIKTDHDDRQCALLRIATQSIAPEQRELFTFKTDFGSEIVERATRNGEIWLWVSPELTYLIIMHRDWGRYELHLLDYVSRVEALHTYKVVVKGTLVPPPPPKRPNQQYLAFQITPPNAYVEVNGNSWEVHSDGSASNIVDFGTYTYRVGAPNYFPKEGTVTVNDPDNTVFVNIALEPNFAEVTLKVDADAEIWVNDEKKGARSWTGILGSGIYKIECKQANHRASMIMQKITPENNGQTINLPAPEPIYGSLKVESTPIKARLYLDENFVDVTPLKRDVLIGTHELRLEKEGCAPWYQSIRVEEGKELKINATLDSGRNVMVKTDREGDKIYVDGKYVGETPRVTPLGFGKHTIRVKRGKNELEKQVEIAINTKNDQELFFEFGRLITIYTDQVGDNVYVDGEEVGSSPVSIDLDFGKHTIYARRGKKYADKDIEVLRNGGLTEHRLVLHRETAADYVKNGVWFSTLNAATSYSGFNQPSYGATIGYVKKVGFFLSAMSNFNFDAKNASLTCNSEGLVDGEYPEYTGKSSNFRFSVLGGLVANGFNDGSPSPFSFRIGAGYGMRIRCLEIADGRLVKVTDNCFSGLDLTAGVQLNIKGFTMSLDAVSSQFETFEMKIGLGYCWKHK